MEGRGERKSKSSNEGTANVSQDEMILSAKTQFQKLTTAKINHNLHPNRVSGLDTVNFYTAEKESSLTTFLCAGNYRTYKLHGKAVLSGKEQNPGWIQSNE